MYNLLIVDDEPRITNGLYEQFLEWNEEELGVFRAYSSTEALNILRTSKIDIVLSDIQMPGMNGIELQQKIHELWPRCKVIFLSGYSDFNYIQSAMRDGGLDYILKIEGDKAIFAAVSKAITRLRDEFESEQLLKTAHQQLDAALPMMQKNFMESLLKGELSGRSINPELFAELELPLDPNGEVLIVVARVDRWSPDTPPRDRSLLMYAVQNIADEYLNQLTTFSLPTTSHLVWFIQPHNGARDQMNLNDWKQTISFVRGTSSDIQKTCKNLLGLPISIAISNNSTPWTNLAVQFLRLEHLLQSGFGPGEEMLLSDNLTGKDLDPTAQLHGMSKQDIVVKLRHVKQLESFLFSGQKEEFFTLFREIMETARILHNAAELHPFLVELEYSLGTMFLSYINQLDHAEYISNDTGPLMNVRGLPTWPDAEHFYVRLAEKLFSFRDDEQYDRTQQVWLKVNQYVESNLAGDLSLEVLANHVYLHPTYLSRLYKQISGIGISDHIKERRLEKARELLIHTRLKVHEVAAQVGFESAHYFTKVFKKQIHMTPQEYRDSLHNNRP